jgi:OOP family OmpA-OmpF porin
MRNGLILLISSIFTLVSSASEFNNEFSYIQPIAVEEAPLTKNVKSLALKNISDAIKVSDKQANVTKVIEKIDANSDTDSDFDGVIDNNDECPNTTEGIIVDTIGCELDSDEDGVLDSKDQCPNTSKDFIANGYGCPQEATLKVNFAPNKYNVSKELIKDLEDFALFLKENSAYDVLIYGYTDSIGEPKENKILSQKRANAIKEALTRYDIKTTRLTAIGKGEANPIADNMYKQGRAKNRRIEVELIH